MTEKKSRRSKVLSQLPLAQGFEFFLSRSHASTSRADPSIRLDRSAPDGLGELHKADYRNLVDAPVPPHLTRLVELLEQRDDEKT